MAAGPPLSLPSAGPDPVPWDTALAAVLGYARGRRPLWFRSPGHPQGRWVRVPAFGYERFDCRPPVAGPLGDDDVLVAEGLHGRLDPAGWAAVRSALDEVGPLADAVAVRADGRRFWELPPGELSVLEEPGTVGAGLRGIGGPGPGRHREHLSAALHHRRRPAHPAAAARRPGLAQRQPPAGARRRPRQADPGVGGAPGLTGSDAPSRTVAPTVPSSSAADRRHASRVTSGVEPRLAAPAG